MGSKREGFAPLMVVLIVLAVIIAGFIVYHNAPSLVAIAHPLQDSDVSGLVAFLKANGLEAAVVQQIYEPNNGSTWIVKSDGTKTLLYAKDLGVYHDIFAIPRYGLDVGGSEPDGVYMLPGGRAVYDTTVRKTYDMSKYVTGNTSEEISIQGVDGRPFFAGPSYAGTSPNMRYAITYPPEGIQVNEVRLQSTGRTLTLIGPVGAGQFISWSPDSNYILLRQTPGVEKGLDIYDVRNKKTTYVDATLDRNTPGGNVFSSFIYPSTLVFSKGGLKGTYALNFATDDRDGAKLLSSDITIVGLIPGPSVAN